VTERLAETTRRIENLHQLDAVVTAMRGISASRAQQARGLLHGLRAHTMVVAGAIGQALSLAPDTPQPSTGRTRRSAIILFCADQGFVGAFNERMLDAAEHGAAGKDLFVIGTRGVALAGDRGQVLAWHAATVPHASLVATLAGRITDALYDWLSNREAHQVEVIVPTWTSAGGVVPERRSLLPFDYRRFAVPISGQPPLITLPPATLLARLAEEYVFAELCEAALTAFAAENEARVAAMLSAKSNLEKMGTELHALERQIRQEEITAEVLELRREV
jgi:F-type H+-transporting ATPase subunit gamma